MFDDCIASIMKKWREFIEGESVIVSSIGTNLDIVVAISSITRGIARLIPEIPVRHIDATSFSEEWLHIMEDTESRLMRLEVVEGGEEEEGVEIFPVIATKEAIQCFRVFRNLDRHVISFLAMTKMYINIEHIADFESIRRMESLSFLDHPSWAIDPEIILYCEFSIVNLFQETPIPTADIEHTRVSLLYHILDDEVEFWPGMMFSTLRECASKVVVGHYFFGKSFSSTLVFFLQFLSTFTRSAR